jgi:polar amino acid transport system substrate-binding protein
MSLSRGWRGALVGAVLFLALAAPAVAQEPAATPPAPAEASPDVPDAVTVAIKVAEPFVFDGERPRGFSIDLWEEAASRANLTTSYQWVDTVGAQLDAVRSGVADAGVAAISITAEREETVDFSKPIFNSGLQVMTRPAGGVSFTDTLSTLFSGPVEWLIILMVGMSLFVGAVIWAVERRDNPDFHRDARHGIFDGLWWAMVTMMTVGYGDRVPRRRIGRVLTIMWMMVGVVFIANFTAVITTNLTVSQIQGEVSGVDDLESGRVTTVRGTTSEAYLRESGVGAVLVETADEAFAALERSDTDAVVYDSPILRYYAETQGRGRVTVVGPVFDREYYGIALASDSPLTERLDQALLSLAEDGTYDAIYQRWFGNDQ